MKAKIAIAAAAGAALLAACGGGNDSCPTTGANVQSASCTFPPAPQQVVVNVQLVCQPCSHSDATCTPDLHAAAPVNGQPGDIFLDTKWALCTDNSSCSVNQSCPLVRCEFSVPSGRYHVHALDQTGTLVEEFLLDTTTAQPSCG